MQGAGATDGDTDGERGVLVQLSSAPVGIDEYSWCQQRGGPLRSAGGVYLTLITIIAHYHL